MSVRVVIDDQVYTLHVAVRRHGKVTLDDDRDHPPILGNGGHVQVDVATSDPPATGQLIQNTSDLFVGNFGVLRIRLESRSRQESLGSQERTRGYESGGGNRAGAQESSTGCLRNRRHQ
jgi:hypothetical protein